MTPKAEALALKIIRHAKNTVLLNMRFLNIALFKLAPVPTDAYAFATDGANLFSAVCPSWAASAPRRAQG